MTWAMPIKQLPWQRWKWAPTDRSHTECGRIILRPIKGTQCECSAEQEGTEKELQKDEQDKCEMCDNGGDLCVPEKLFFSL